MSKVSFPNRKLSPGIWGLVRNLVAIVNQLSSRTADLPLQTPNLGIHSTATQMTVAAFHFRNNGVQYEKFAAVAITFTAAHKVAQYKYGAVLIMIEAGGTITTKIKAAAQDDTLEYDTAAEAVANLPECDATKTPIGHVVIGDSAQDPFTCNTHDLTGDAEFTNYFAKQDSPDTITYRGGGTPS